MVNYLYEFRKEKGLSQEKMARKLGISTSYYLKIENGIRNPSYNFLKKFKEVFPEADMENFFNLQVHVQCINE